MHYSTIIAVKFSLIIKISGLDWLSPDSMRGLADVHTLPTGQPLAKTNLI